MIDIENDLHELCTKFLQLLIQLRHEEKISKSEYELHAKAKQNYIHKVKGKVLK